MPTATTALLRFCRRPALRACWTAVIAVMLLAAEAFAVSHPLDSASHANGEHCYVCVSVAGLGHGAVADSLVVVVDTARAAVAPLPELAAAITSPPDRPPVRGPPSVS